MPTPLPPFKPELAESLDKAASDKTRPGLEINSPGGCSEPRGQALTVRPWRRLKVRQG